MKRSLQAMFLVLLVVSLGRFVQAWPGDYEGFAETEKEMLERS